MFFENLAEFLRPRRHKLAGPPGAFWNSVLIPQHTPARGLTASLAIHAAVIGILILTRDFPMQGVKMESPLRYATITRYSVSDFLPALQVIAPEKAALKPEAAKADASGAPGRLAAKATEPPSNETALAKASPLAMPVAPSASVAVVVA